MEKIIPAEQNRNMVPTRIQVLMRELASQEGCDGEAWDLMKEAAEYIDLLEFTLECESAKFEGRTTLAYRLGEDIRKLEDHVESTKALVFDSQVCEERYKEALQIISAGHDDCCPCVSCSALNP